MADLQTNIFDEILSSERIGMYMSFAYNLPAQAMPDDPSWIWQQIRWNPWLAMAVFDDIEEKDAMVASTLDTRKDGVLAKPRVVLPASGKRQDIRLAEFIDETLNSYFDVASGVAGRYFGFDNFLSEALDAVGKGVSIGEIIYSQGSDRIFVRDVKFKPQHLFSFGDTSTSTYSTSTYQYPQTGPLRTRHNVYAPGLPDDGLLPEQKFFVHSYRPRYSNRWGSPLMRKIFWPSWFKRAGAKQWLRNLEKGNGSVVARYPDGAAPSEQSRALEAAQAVSEEPSVAIPQKFILEVLQHVRQSGGQYNEFVDNFCNAEIARAILGQTLTSRGSDGGGSRALGEVHDQVRGEKIESDANSLMLAVNTRFVFPLVLLNQGPVTRPPIWTIKYNPQQDLTATSEWLTKLWEMHVPIKRSYVYTTFQLPEATPVDDDVLPPPGDDRTTQPPSPDADDPAFSESKKKTLADRSSGTSRRPRGSKTERFARLRPSTMRRSDK